MYSACTGLPPGLLIRKTTPWAFLLLKAAFKAPINVARVCASVIADLSYHFDHRSVFSTVSKGFDRLTCKHGNNKSNKISSDKKPEERSPATSTPHFFDHFRSKGLLWFDVPRSRVVIINHKKQSPHHETEGLYSKDSSEC